MNRRERFSDLAIVTRIAISAAAFVMAVSWISMAGIEWKATSYPRRPTGQYSEPVEIKGITRYVTTSEAATDKWAGWGWYGGWVVALGTALAHLATKNRSDTSSS